MTQLQAAQQGLVTEAMKIVAADEGVDAVMSIRQLLLQHVLQEVLICIYIQTESRIIQSTLLQPMTVLQ